MRLRAPAQPRNRSAEKQARSSPSQASLPVDLLKRQSHFATTPQLRVALARQLALIDERLDATGDLLSFGIAIVRALRRHLGDDHRDPLPTRRDNRHDGFVDAAR